MSWKQKIRQLTTGAGLLGVLGASLSGCGGGGGALPTGTDRSACIANPHLGGRARWTVLVYLNSANNLQPDSLTNVAQMASIGSDTDVNILVQWKQANCTGCGSPTFNETRRYKVSKHAASDVAAIQAGNTTVLNSDLLPPPANLYDPTTKQSDMGDWRVLKDFVKWGSANYPADHLMVVVWNHGAGWRPTRGANRAASFLRSVSIDDATNNEIRNEQIPLGLAGTAQPIDVLAFDASLMQMTEVAYEVRNSARVMVGSEDSPPGSGYPYDAVLTALKQSGQNPCVVGESIVDDHINTYINYTDATQSLIDLSTQERSHGQR